MSMSERICRLRQQSLSAVPAISTERAELMTDFHREHTELMSAPLQRALAFRHLMECKQIYIGEEELIVGEKGPAPKATPTYPELCCHSLQDLDILNSREKVSFKVSPEARRVYEETIIPFWRGKSMRDLIFQEMDPEWRSAYEAGIFTEFMEQRSPGHTVLDNKIYRKGMLDFMQDIQNSLQGLDFFNDPQVYAKQQELEAMVVCADALIRFAERHAERAQRARPPQRQPEARADEADRDREVLEVAEEPERRLVPELPVPLALGYPVDRSGLDQPGKGELRRADAAAARSGRRRAARRRRSSRARG